MLAEGDGCWNGVSEARDASKREDEWGDGDELGVSGEVGSTVGEMSSIDRVSEIQFGGRMGEVMRSEVLDSLSR